MKLLSFNVFKLFLISMISYTTGTSELPESLPGIPIGQMDSWKFGHGIKCTLGSPRGEDGIKYCPTFTEQEINNMNKTAKELLLVTVPGRGKDVEARFKRSASVYDYTVKILGEEEDRLSPKVALHHLSLFMKKLNEDDPLRLVMYLDGVDTVVTAGSMRVVEEFQLSGAAVLLSGDGLCWPDRALESQFPKVERGKRFLNAGAMVGVAEDLWAVLQEATEEEGSLQELLTRLYIKDATRKKFRLEIDSRSNLFQNLHGSTGDLEIRFAGKEAYLQNTMFSTVPAVVRANEDTELVLNNLASYLARSWNLEDGCRSCWDDMIKLEDKKDEELPVVLLGVFIEKETPFLQEFFEKLSTLNYPKKKIHLFLHNSIDYHEPLVSGWVEQTGELFNSSEVVNKKDKMKEWHAKNQAIALTKEKNCQFLFIIDSEAHLDNPYVLKLLIEQNRSVVAPMLTRPYKAWSNFWGQLTSEGFYARSDDYMEIVQNQRRGLWNVPYVSTCYLINRNIFDQFELSYINNLMDPDMAFCHNLRSKGVFMHVSNRVDFGHLINADEYIIERINPELWQLFNNRWDWEVRYLHENFTHYVSENTTVEMPCPDVYWFPLFKERFAKEMIEVMESHGTWSDGSSNDPRLEGGYESVPTIDIHMKQILYEQEWLDILRVYVMPMQQKVFDGYFSSDGVPHAIMNFMVRYKPDEQPELRPHHDTSTYTINVAMNKPGIDYKGGGCRFLRYDCKVTDTRVGWLLMHPGRLTHLHEGLRVTNGTRYIIVSFVDP